MAPAARPGAGPVARGDATRVFFWGIFLSLYHVVDVEDKEEKKTQPRGRPRKGMTWDGYAWVEMAEKEDEDEEEEGGDEEEKEVAMECGKCGKPYKYIGALKSHEAKCNKSKNEEDDEDGVAMTTPRPAGRPPNGKTWNEKLGEYVDDEKKGEKKATKRKSSVSEEPSFLLLEMCANDPNPTCCLCDTFTFIAQEDVNRRESRYPVYSRRVRTGCA